MVKETYKKISSLQNPIVKHFVKLKESRSYREKEKKAVVFGYKNVMQIGMHFSPFRILATDVTKLSALPFQADSFLVSQPILKKIAALSSFDDVIAEFAIPEPQNLQNKNHLVAFDEISDPGNLGTLIRTALALNWQGAFLLPGCCDLFNDKTIRSSKGGCFLLPYEYTSHEALFEQSKQMNSHLLIADLNGEDVSKVPSFAKVILLLSNEAKGVKEIVSLHGKKISIPISSAMESLNVAAAGAILMFQLKNS